MKKLALLLLTLLILTSCATNAGVEVIVAPATHLYGFWAGVWHGMISSFSFIGSLFSDNIVIYAYNNNGGWYDFGFVGGLGIAIKFVVYILKMIAVVFSD